MADAGIDNLPWDEIQEISEKGLFEQVFIKIPKARFRFASEDKNRPVLIESALKSLKKKNPDATYEKAIVLADVMQAFAKKVFEEKV